jgi:hypothetical protein
MSKTIIASRLRSKLFHGDPRLEAAAVSDPAHVLPGASGPHVGKIQLALILLDAAVIADSELDSLTYGDSTARAVLAYKRKRNIVNRSYQTQADNIVGKMTMASLDGEMVKKEPLASEPTRIFVNYPRPRRAYRREAFAPRVGIQQVLGFQGGPLLNVAAHSPSVPRLELRVNQLGSITVTDGQGKRIMCHDAIAFIFDPTKSENSQSGVVTVTEKRQVFHVRARTPGRAHIWIKGPTGPTTLGGIISVMPDVFIEVNTFFHFLVGPKGNKTDRTPGDIGDLLDTMNKIYGDQASFKFVIAGVNPSLSIPGLGSGMPGVPINRNGSTADHIAIKARKANVFFNVFFVGNVIDVTNKGKPQTILANTSKPPDDAKPLRCCICRDDIPGVNVGETLAHEAGHALGEDDDKHHTDSLMFWTTVGQTDNLIYPSMAERMWKSFGTYPQVQ